MLRDRSGASARTAIHVALWASCLWDASVFAAGGDRRVETTYIVVHAVSGPLVDEPASWSPACRQGTLQYAGKSEKTAREWATELRRDTKAHYVVGERGEVERALASSLVANHAGYSRIGTDPRNPNEYSIAIELINDADGNDVYEPEQLDALVCLVRDLRDEFSIQLNHIVRHSDIDSRAVHCPHLSPPTVKVKQDPGANFPWNEFIVRLADGPSCEPR